MKIKRLFIKRNNYKLKGGILPYVLVVSLIIAVLCATMILFTYYNSLFWTKIKRSDKMELNQESALEYALATGVDSFDYALPYYVDLFGEGDDSIQILKNKWGLFDLLEITAFDDTLSEKQAYILGSHPDDIEMAALYVSNSSSLPVTLVGDASIVGDAYLPSGGVKAGSINKRKYTGSKLIEGAKKQSNNEIPELKTKNSSMIKYYLGLLNSAIKNNKEDKAYIKQSFLKSEYLLMSDNVIELKDTLLGKVIVVSKEKVVLNKSSVIKNVIVVAPEIEIEAGFRGDLEGFALDKISVGEGACLEYPSLLCVENKTNSSINIESNVEVRGTLLMVDISEDAEDENGTIILEKNSLVVGQIVSGGYVNIQGKVYGNLICKSSWYDNNTSTFINYFVDCSINRKQLLSTFLFVNLFGSNNETNEIVRDLKVFE